MAPPNRIERARKYRQVRLDAGLTQAEFAKKLGVVEKTVHRWESGQSPPRGRNLAQLAEVAKESISSLRGERQGLSIQDFMVEPETDMELGRIAAALEHLAMREEHDAPLATLLREFRDRLLAEARQRSTSEP